MSGMGSTCSCEAVCCHVSDHAAGLCGKRVSTAGSRCGKCRGEAPGRRWTSAERETVQQPLRRGTDSTGKRLWKELAAHAEAEAHLKQVKTWWHFTNWNDGYDWETEDDRRARGGPFPARAETVEAALKNVLHKAALARAPADGEGFQRRSR